MLLLHLSDIHFRYDQSGTALDPNASLRNEILLDAEAQCRRLAKQPDAILISGDIAYFADRAEYKFAEAWLEQLCQRCGTTMASVFTVPGNHDVAWSVAGKPIMQSLHHSIKKTDDITLESSLRGILQDEEAGKKLYEPLAAYNEFAARFFCSVYPPNETIARRDLLLNDGSILRLNGFNSALISSKSDAKNEMFVDPACFQLIRDAGVVHLAMCHHPYSWLRQGEKLKDHLDELARLHLFGHEHTNRIDMGRDFVRIFAGAAHPDREEGEWEPGYNLVELEVSGGPTERKLEVKVHVRVWQQRPGTFRAKIDRNQKEYFAQSISLDNWVSPAPTQQDNTPKRGGGASDNSEARAVRSDPMAAIREVSIRFFKLTLSQKAAVAGKLDLLDDSDTDQPDFEKFRRVLLRAKERGLVDKLETEIAAVERR